jgi:hypothetical protein
MDKVHETNFTNILQHNTTAAYYYNILLNYLGTVVRFSRGFNNTASPRDLTYRSGLSTVVCCMLVVPFIKNGFAGEIQLYPQKFKLCLTLTNNSHNVFLKTLCV